MTGVERALRALNFRDVDRVPMLGGFIAHAELLTEAGGIDVWENSRKAAIEAAKKLGADMIIQLVLPKLEETTDMRAKGNVNRSTLPIEDMQVVVQGKDAVDISVPMEGLGRLSGRPVRIEFTLCNGQLYAFWVD